MVYLTNFDWSTRREIEDRCSVENFFTKWAKYIAISIIYCQNFKSSSLRDKTAVMLVAVHSLEFSHNFVVVSAINRGCYKRKQTSSFAI